MMPKMEISLSNPRLLEILGFIILFGTIGSTVLLGVLHHKYPASSKQLTQTLECRAWSNRQTGLLLACFVCSILLLSVLTAFIANSANPVSGLLLTLFFAGTQMVILLFIGRQRQAGWPQDFGMDLRRLKLAPLALVVYLATALVLGFSTYLYHSLLEHYLNMDVQMQDVATLILESRAWVKVCYIILAVLIAPLYEELIFRGVIFPCLIKRVGLPSAITVTSIVFALIHFHIPSIFPLFLLSAILCLAYWRTGTLWVSIGIHAVYNGMSIILLFMQ